MATTTDTSRRIARAVSNSLKAAGIAQRDAAALTGIPTSTLTRRLTGKSPLNTDELDMLASVAGTTVIAIIERATKGAA